MQIKMINFALLNKIIVLLLRFFKIMVKLLLLKDNIFKIMFYSSMLQ